MPTGSFRKREVWSWGAVVSVTNRETARDRPKAQTVGKQRLKRKTPGARQSGSGVQLAVIPVRQNDQSSPDRTLCVTYRAHRECGSPFEDLVYEFGVPFGGSRSNRTVCELRTGELTDCRLIPVRLPGTKPSPQPGRRFAARSDFRRAANPSFRCRDPVLPSRTVFWCAGRIVVLFCPADAAIESVVFVGDVFRGGTLCVAERDRGQRTSVSHRKRSCSTVGDANSLDRGFSHGRRSR